MDLKIQPDVVETKKICRFNCTYMIFLWNWCPTNLFYISKGVSFPVRIDERTIEKENGLYARVQINVDLTAEFHERILVKRKQLNFFLNLKYENLPRMCSNYGAIGHFIKECRKHCVGSSYNNTKFNGRNNFR